MLARDWGKDPGWFYTLTREEQADVVADWNLRHRTPEERDTRNRARMRAEFDARLRALRGG